MVGKVDGSRLVFVDEMGTHTSFAPLYAYAPRGKRAFFKAPRSRGKNTTLLASISWEGMGPSMAIEGSTTREVFEAYVEHFLAPELRPGQVVVMDNLRAHKGERVRELIQGRGCELLYLPPYSPDLNPIEEAFAKLKTLLRKTGARTREALVEAMGRALDAVTARDARGFFEHSGTTNRSNNLERRCMLPLPRSFRGSGSVAPTFATTNERVSRLVPASSRPLAAPASWTRHYHPNRGGDDGRAHDLRDGPPRRKSRMANSRCLHLSLQRDNNLDGDAYSQAGGQFEGAPHQLRALPHRPDPAAGVPPVLLGEAPPIVLDVARDLP